MKRLKAQYAFHRDNGYDADGVASLFVEDSSGKVMPLAPIMAARGAAPLSEQGPADDGGGEW